jgi:16S rRNA (cytidine1402-2'-O)-methyltransferase
LESAIYVVSTPIGNLADITLRAIDILKAVDVVAAEDTRHTRKLLEHYGIKAKMLSLHEHNESERSEYIVDSVLAGQSVALVSDAGTPLISDPGHTLIHRAKTQNVTVVPIPGPSALIAALSVSGIACGKFIFEGFLPAKRKAKNDILQTYLLEKRAVVFYESPHRILDTLAEMLIVFGGRQMCVARELTKRYETVKRDNIENIIAWMKDDSNQQKGEFVLILDGSSEEEKSASDQEKAVLLNRLLVDLPPKKASAIVADILGGTKKEIYNMALMLKDK